MAKLSRIEQKLEQISAIATSGYYLALHLNMIGAEYTYKTFRPDWLEYYAKNLNTFRDPVVVWGLTHFGAIRWSNIDIPDPFSVMEAAKPYGLNFGAVVAHGCLDDRSILSIARHDRELTDDEVVIFSKYADEIHRLTAAKPKLRPWSK